MLRICAPWSMKLRRMNVYLQEDMQNPSGSDLPLSLSLPCFLSFNAISVHHLLRESELHTLELNMGQGNTLASLN